MQSRCKIAMTLWGQIPVKIFNSTWQPGEANQKTGRKHDNRDNRIENRDEKHDGHSIGTSGFTSKAHNIDNIPQNSILKHIS